MFEIETENLTGDQPQMSRVAPSLDFQVPDADERPRSLKDLMGRKGLVLFFYPKDMTSGCTQEAQEFRDLYSDFCRTGWQVAGLSPDSPKRHRTFREKYELPFPLLSDVTHEVCEQYGVWIQKKLYGRTYSGVERSTFVITPQKKVILEFRKVKPAGHAQVVLESLQKTDSRR